MQNAWVLYLTRNAAAEESFESDLLLSTMSIRITSRLPDNHVFLLLFFAMASALEVLLCPVLIQNLSPSLKTDRRTNFVTLHGWRCGEGDLALLGLTDQHS